jgi:tetratricopeptide (TPR) repeat protein
LSDIGVTPPKSWTKEQGERWNTIDRPSREYFAKLDRYKAFAADLLRSPDDSDALVNQFSHLAEFGDKLASNSYFVLAERAWRINPDDVNTKFNYGSALNRTGRYSEALIVFCECVTQCRKYDIKEWLARSLQHVGITMRALGRNDEAVEWYDKAIKLSEGIEKLNIQKDRALALMAAGKLSEGLQAFEVRRQIAEFRFKKNGELIGQKNLPVGITHWEGQDLKGKSICVYHEEGSGDFIMVSRFMPELRKRGAAKLYLAGPVHDLLEMVSDQFDIDGILSLQDTVNVDYVIASMSLPWRVGIDQQDVSGRPYFKAEPAPFPKRGIINVGLVWRGNPKYGTDMHRSMPFAELCPLFSIPDVAFYSLQVGMPGSEVTKLGMDGFVADLAPFAKSWRATAKLIKALDLVISVDTAAAHLAGALGVPVIILVPKAADWRWDRNRSQTVWYDSAIVLRQFYLDDWAPSVSLAKTKLEDMLDESKSRQDAIDDFERPESRRVATG